MPLQVKNLDYLLDSTTASIIETMNKISFIDGNWWVDILYEIQGTSNESLLIEKIRMDLQESGCSPMTDEYVHFYFILFTKYILIQIFFSQPQNINHPWSQLCHISLVGQINKSS